jgi:hypothetical protein
MYGPVHLEGANAMRTLILSFILMVEVAGGSAAAQVTVGSPQAAPSTLPDPVEKQMRKTVSFITMACLDGNLVSGLEGTGFFVSVSDSRIPGHDQFLYLVTNRHMAMCWDAPGHDRRARSAYVRLNLRDGSSRDVPYPGSVPWILPADASVDLALLPLNISPDQVDYLAIPDTMLATDDVVKKESVSEGLKIVFSGFFYQFPGEQRMQPIIREGVLAMMPDEDLVTTTGVRGKVYLGEVHAFHGNSGSPVFVDLGGLRGSGMKLGADYRLLGVVSGGYDEDATGRLSLTLDSAPGSRPGNSGIAMIVPASALRSLLDDPRTVAIRAAEVARVMQIKK